MYRCPYKHQIYIYIYVYICIEKYISIAHGYKIIWHNSIFSQSCYAYPGLPLLITVDNCNYQFITRGINSQLENMYVVSNYSFTIWYMVFYKHGGGTEIFRLI